jgi:hypothetical protein
MIDLNSQCGGRASRHCYSNLASSSPTTLWQDKLVPIFACQMVGASD